MGIVDVVKIGLGFSRSQELCALKLVEEVVDFVGREDPPDFSYECRQLGGKAWIIFGSVDETEASH